MFPVPYEAALQLLQQAFPDHAISVEDSDWLENGDAAGFGVVLSSAGEQVASFALVSWGVSRESDQIPLVDEIHTGRIGQFCGTSDEQHRYALERTASLGATR